MANYIYCGSGCDSLRFPKKRIGKQKSRSMDCFDQKSNCLICIDWKRIALLIRLTTVPVRQSHTIVSSLLWALQAFILNLSPVLEESVGHTVPVPLEKCRIFLEKNGEKWPVLRKITAAKSHDFAAVGTPGRIWTSDPSLRSDLETRL